MPKQLKMAFVFLFSLLLVLGIIFRAYNLSWGAPWYFHPDERNIAGSVTQLSYPQQMNPKFFAYGSLPIYSIYFSGVIWNTVSSYFEKAETTLNPIPVTSVAFEKSIHISRIFSILLSIGTLILLFFIAKKLASNAIAYVVVILASLSVGFVQYSHFGTFEMWLTFFLTLLFLTVLRFIQTKSKKDLIVASIVLGILISIKISSLIFIPLVIIPLLYVSYKRFESFQVKKRVIYTFAHSTASTLFVLLGAFLVVLSTSPFTVIDFESFRGNIMYEQAVARGTLPVFYTGGFFDTTPILFHFSKIYPYILNPFITLLFVPLFFLFIVTSVKEKKLFYLLLILFFLFAFLSQAFLFVKWTRYMIPTLPFIYLITTLALYSIIKTLRIRNLLFAILITISLLYSFAFVKTVYISSDSRVEASLWAKNTIFTNSKIVSEVYDLGITPFNPSFSSITLFNFYDLEASPLGASPQDLEYLLESNDYIILPSQRIMRNRLVNPEKFPEGYMFYTKLFDGTLGYEKIYQTPCDFWCKATYMGNPIWNVEETANVFDRPTVFIFKKIRP